MVRADRVGSFDASSSRKRDSRLLRKTEEGIALLPKLTTAFADSYDDMNFTPPRLSTI
jgi:hypothetical protein